MTHYSTYQLQNIHPYNRIYYTFITFIMLKEELKDTFATKDQLVEEMVLKTYKALRDMGEFQSIQEIFGKLPISRIEKDQYQFLFDSVRQNVEGVINKQNLLQKILEKQQESVKKIEVKKFRDFSFDDVMQNCYNEKLQSSRPIFKSIIFLRNQNTEKFKEQFGEEKPFLPDQEYIKINEIKQEIGDIRLILEDEPPLKKYQFQFVDQNNVQFKSRNFPDIYNIDKRAETLAKMYLLHLYRQEGRKAKAIYKNNENQIQKQREIRKIKQELDVQKLKEGEMIEEMDLIKQVYKILMLIEKKMNELAYQQFVQKHGDKAITIKKSLQKLKTIVNDEPSAKVKLKTLINYKHKKGW